HPLLVTIEQEAGSSQGPNTPVAADHTEFLDASKLKSGAIASREANTYVVLAKSGGARDIVVGRSQECDIWIDSTKVSKKHAAFEKEKGGGFSLRDLGSTNGTYLNDRRLDKEERVTVKPSDSVRFGR